MQGELRRTLKVTLLNWTMKMLKLFLNLIKGTEFVIISLGLIIIAFLLDQINA